MPLTEADVKRHVGDRAMRRVRWYDVDDPVVQVDTLLGRVAGFQVQAVLAEPLTTRCTCLYRQRCDHAAVLLMAWVTSPERFAREEPVTLQLPDERAALLELLLQSHAVLLDEPIEQFLAGPPPRHLAHRTLDRLEQVLKDTDDVSALLAGIAARIERRQRRDAAIERARVWRLQPPDEAVLLPLYEACRAELDEVDLNRPPGSFGRVELGEGERLVFRAEQHPHQPQTLPIQSDLLEACAPAWRRDLAGIALDSLIGQVDPTLRAEVLEVLATPLWQRSLAQLDAALALVGPREPMHVGWRVECEGPRVKAVSPVLLTPYKGRSGYRTKKLAAGALVELTEANDRAALGALRSKAAVPLVLEQLVDHSSVVDEAGELIRVRRSKLEIAVHEGAGWRIEVRVDGRPVSAEALGSIAPVGGLAAVRLGSTVALLDVEPVLEGLFAVLARFGERFPVAARKALVQRLQVLESVVPLQLEGSLRGQELEADLTPELRLLPLTDGALRVDLVVRPLPGGTAYRPGEGPPELSRLEEGVRHFVRRRLESEARSVAAALGDLPLPSFRDGIGTLEDANSALELVWQLRQRKDLRVVWPQHRISVRSEVKSLRVGLTRRHDWFGMSIESEGSKVSLKELLEAVRAGRSFVPIDDRAWVRITVELQEALKLTASLATDEAEPRLPPLAVGRALLALESAALKVELPEELLDLEDRIRAADALEATVPEGLNATLRPYQLEGLAWMRRLTRWAPGAILADEMGLGKTLQALALILERGGKALVVAPASVNFNWAREAARFTPGLAVHLYRGADRDLEADAGLWITSYELLIRDAPALSEVKFDTVVFDEAQALKNPLTRRSKAARSLNPGFVLALSGTPLENHLLELWALLRVVAPGLLGPREHFLSRYGQPLMRGEQLAGGRLSQLLKPFLLRRTKALVAPELPDRVETVEYLQLDASERVLYERFRRAAVGAIGEGKDRMSVLAALTRLRQIACAAHLVDAEAPPESSKLRRLVERVEMAREGDEKVLVFSQFTALLDLADTALQRRGIRTLRLDGRTPVAKRPALVDAFQAGEADVFLIALKAGGTGLNLTAASTVILLDPWWNPASEDQASDRAHRIGQTATVQVVRLVAAGTVEEQVLAMHTEKRELAERVLDGTEGSQTLRADDLIALLTADAAGTP